jgi:signal transduction histidine kinase
LELLDGALIFVAGIFGFTGGHAAIAYRRQRRAELRVLALLCCALFVAAIARVYANRSGGALFDRIAITALVPSVALVDHYAILYGRFKNPTPLLQLVYGLTLLVLVLAGSGALGRGGMALELALLVAAVGVGGFLWVFARAYLRGRRHAFPVVVGAVVLLAAILNDIGLNLGLLDTTPLMLIGFVAPVFTLSVLQLEKFWTVAGELERSRKALRERSRELRRSHGQLRSTQLELVRKEQLAVVGELAAVIAHEVRNPLAIVANAVAGLKKEGMSREDQATLLGILDEEVERLNRLVTDLLGYARPLALQRTQLAVDDLVDRALGLTKNRSGVRVTVERDAKDTRVWGDANHLRQVFDNLIDNAVQAMEGEGQLTVRLRAATMDGSDGLAVDIVDTGEGMDTMVRKRAKDPFFTTRPSGTGLGLAIVDRIVDAHGGQFLIESHAGEGTTATVFLPFGRASEPPLSSRNGRRAAGEKGAAASEVISEH